MLGIRLFNQVGVRGWVCRKSFLVDKNAAQFLRAAMRRNFVGVKPPIGSIKLLAFKRANIAAVRTAVRCLVTGFER